MDPIPGLRPLDEPIDVDVLNENFRWLADELATVERRLVTLSHDVDQLRAAIAATSAEPGE